MPQGARLHWQHSGNPSPESARSRRRLLSNGRLSAHVRGVTTSGNSNPGGVASTEDRQQIMGWPRCVAGEVSTRRSWRVKTWAHLGPKTPPLRHESRECRRVRPTDSTGLMVEAVGIEPTTSSMPWKRAPSCATGPRLKTKSPRPPNRDRGEYRIHFRRWHSTPTRHFTSQVPRLGFQQSS